MTLFCDLNAEHCVKTFHSPDASRPHSFFFVLPTDAGGQRVVPGPPLACHALERGGAVQRVSRLAAVRDAAPGEVALVVDLEAELRHAGVLAMRQLKTWRKEREIVTGKARQCGTLKILSPRGVQQRKPN